MTHRRVAGFAIAAGLIAGLFVPPAAATAAEAYEPISGTGSTWAQNAMDQWRRDVAASPGLPVNYSGTGSSAGRTDFINGTVDFAISELPFQLRGESNSAPEDPSGRPYAYLPIVAGGTSLMYNLVIDGRRVTDLRLSGEAIAKIFAGQITRWDDAAIQADNPALALPSRSITPVYRSDGSGTSAHLTRWMSTQFPSIWTQGERSQFPPANTTFKGQNGSLGVSGYVSQSYGEGSITYVETAYAVRAGFPTAKVLNAAGYFVAPSADAVSIALRGARVADDPASPDHLTQNLDGVYRSADPRAYPLSNYTYLIVPTATGGVFTAAKGPSLAAFARYAVCEGQRDASRLGNAPLPRNLVGAAAEQIAQIPGAAGIGIDLDDCGNPTFAPGDSDESTALDRSAPMPPAEDKRPGHVGDADLAAHDATDVRVEITATDRFELVAPVTTSVDFGNVARGTVTPLHRLGRFTVIDDREVLGGWAVTIEVEDLVGRGDPDNVIARRAVGYAPEPIAVPSGVTIGAAQAAGRAAYPADLASGAPGTGTGLRGADFETALSFLAPADSAQDTYHSTVTLTLISR